MVRIDAVWLADVDPVALDKLDQVFHLALVLDEVLALVCVATEFHGSICCPRISVLVIETALDQQFPDVTFYEGVHTFKFLCFNPVGVPDARACWRFLLVFIICY